MEYTAEIQAFLKQFPFLSQEDIDQFLKIGRSVTLAKEDFFIREGVVCNKVGFLCKGILRTFYYSSNDEEVSYCFTFPGTFISAYSSYLTGAGSVENIQALEESQLIVFDKTELEALINENTSWLLFSRLLAEQQYIEMENRVLMLQREPAEVRYSNLINKQPDLLQKVPLQYIASYLGVTKRHLSRLRQNYKQKRTNVL